MCFGAGMKRSPALPPVAVFLLLACGSDSPTYSLDTERAAIARVTGAWKSADGAVEMTICEDTATLDGTCSFAYQLRSTGGIRLAEHRAGGCPGGCSFGLGAAMRVKITGVTPAAKVAAIPVGYGEDDGEPDTDPGFTSFGSTPQSPSIDGRLMEDGSFRLQLGYEPHAYTLTRSGSAECN